MTNAANGIPFDFRGNIFAPVQRFPRPRLRGLRVLLNLPSLREPEGHQATASAYARGVAMVDIAELARRDSCQYSHQGWRGTRVGTLAVAVPPGAENE